MSSKSEDAAQRILLLDDEESVLDILGQLLGPQGYRCVATTSPLDALQRIEKEGFGLLITDIKMPEMNGIDVVIKAKEIDPDISIVVITALLDVGNAIKGMRSGADDYVLKPFNLREITASVRQALEKRSRLLENRDYTVDLETRVIEATEDLERVNRELRETKQYLENLIDSTLDAIITITIEGKISFINEGGLRMLGYESAEIVDKDAAFVLSGKEDEMQFIRRMLNEAENQANYETELRRKDDSTVPVNVSLSLVRNANERVVSILAVCRDITDQMRLQKELQELSVKDGLTGLYNQRHFYERLEAEIERARRQQHPLSLVLCDLDYFKQYNDTRGHLEGDKALQVVGQVIQESTRANVDMGFRYGGDEFTIILPEADKAMALAVTERLRMLFRGHELDALTLSIGVLTYSDGMSIRTFVQSADALMYEAKRAGGNRVVAQSAE